MTFKKLFFFINFCCAEEIPNLSKPISSTILNPAKNFKKFNNNRQLKINIKQRFVILPIYLSNKYKLFFFSGAFCVLLSEFPYPLQWSLMNLITRPFLFLMIKFADSKVASWYQDDQKVNELILKYQNEPKINEPTKLKAKATNTEKKTYKKELKAYKDGEKAKANDRKKILDECLSDKDKFAKKILLFTSFLVVFYGAIFVLRYLTSLNNDFVKDRLIEKTLGSIYTKLDLGLCALYLLGGYGVIFFIFKKSLIKVLDIDVIQSFVGTKTIPGTKGSQVDIKANLINVFQWTPLAILSVDFINSVILFKQLPAFLKENNRDIISELFAKEEEIQRKAMLIQEAKDEKLRKIQEAKDKKQREIEEKLEKERQQKLTNGQKLEEEKKKQKELSRIKSTYDDKNSETMVIDPAVSAYHQQEYINDMGNRPDFVYDSYGNQEYQESENNNGDQPQNNNQSYNDEYGY